MIFRDTLVQSARFVADARRALAASPLVAVAVATSSCIITLSSVDLPDGGSSNSSGSSSELTLPGSWSPDPTGNLVGTPSQCGSLSAVFVKPDEDFLLAGVSPDQNLLNTLAATQSSAPPPTTLWGSRDGGMTWKRLGAGAGSESIGNRPSSIVFDPINTQTFWVSGIYSDNSHGLFVTHDDGNTFTHLDYPPSTTNPQSIGNIDFVSVDLTDTARQTIVAGEHERTQQVYRSTDGGTTWTNIGLNLPNGPVCNSPYVIDSMHYLVACYEAPLDAGTENGIYLTADAGQTWTQVLSGTPIYGPAVPMADGSIFWAGQGGAGLWKGTGDYTSKNWTQVTSTGTIADHEGLLTFTPIPVAVSSTSTGLAVQGEDVIQLSTDEGKTWTQVTNGYPPPAGELLPDGATLQGDVHGIAYSAMRKVFYIWHNACPNFPTDSVAVASDAIESFPYPLP